MFVIVYQDDATSNENSSLFSRESSLSGQLSTQTCAEVVISASQSSGSGGRALTVRAVAAGMRKPGIHPHSRIV